MLNENSTDETADEMKKQSKTNMQGEDHYLLHYRGTYITPPYSDKMSRERVGWDHKKEIVIKKQRQKAYNQRHLHTNTLTENKNK